MGPDGLADAAPVATPAGVSGRAFITVTDAAGRVLFRRPATDAEVAEARGSAAAADREGQAAMDRIAHDRLAAELADFEKEIRP